MASEEAVDEAPWTGAVLAGGLAAVVRIPLPGPGNLAISLRPPKDWGGKSTCTVFIMQTKWKGLRLDYSPNVKTKTIDYHWNRRGFGDRFPIPDHAPAGRMGAVLYEGARAFKYLGTTMVVVGAVLDVESIVVASNPLRRSTQVASGWALAWAGARSAGAVGAEVGSFVEPGLGTAAGGLIFGIGGAAVGYWAGSKAGAEIFDWAAGTRFDPLPQTAVPADIAGMMP